MGKTRGYSEASERPAWAKAFTNPQPVSLLIKNTSDMGNSLNVRIVTKNIADGDLSYVELDTTVLAPTEMIRYFQKEYVGYLAVMVADASSGNPAQYTIEDI